jgi:hypothetical protein
MTAAARVSHSPTSLPRVTIGDQVLAESGRGDLAVYVSRRALRLYARAHAMPNMPASLVKERCRRLDKLESRYCPISAGCDAPADIQRDAPFFPAFLAFPERRNSFAGGERLLGAAVLGATNRQSKTIAPMQVNADFSTPQRAPACGSFIWPAVRSSGVVDS